MKLVESLEHKSDEELAEGAGAVQLGEKEVQGGCSWSLHLPEGRL